MKKLTVSETRDYLKLDGKKFFYLADTVWSAFTNASLDEWEEYLEYRRKQGFNALQINILPQWDRSRPNAAEAGIPAFNTDREGNIDFYNMNEAYFTKAIQMTKMASDRGFIPALVLLWGDYVENPWALSLKPCRVFPMDAIQPYIEYVIKAFSQFSPIYLVSGDNDFKYESTHPYYLKALEIVKSISPHAITTLHINTLDLPEAFVQSKHLDLYMYQSGHIAACDCVKPVYKMASDFYCKSIKRPVINGELCYEGMGCAFRHERFSAFDVRKQVWQSLLSGAKAGFTYGAHGLWSWHKKGNFFPSIQCFNTPYDWKTALRFPGANDAAFAKWLFETYALFDIEPLEIAEDGTEEVRLSASADGRVIVFYIPYNTEVKTSEVLDGYEWTLIALNERVFAKPTIEYEENKSVIKMHDFNSDVLVIGVRY